MLFTLVRRYVRPYRWLIAVVLLLQLVNNLASLYLPTVNASIIDDGVAKGDTSTTLYLGGLMLAATGVQVLSAFGAVYTSSRASMGFGRDLRLAVFRHIAGLAEQDTAPYGAPSLLTRTTNDVAQVEAAVQMTSTVLITAPILGIGGIAMAIHQNAGLSWLLAVSVPVLAATTYLVVVKVRPFFATAQKLVDTINNVMREQLSGVKVIRAFVRQHSERDHFAKVNQELSRTYVAAGRWDKLMVPVAMLVVNLSSVAVVWFGGLRINAGEMQVGSLIAFLSYFMQILGAAVMATLFFQELPRASVCAGRISEVLCATPTIVSPPAGGQPSRRIQGDVRLDKVTFCYRGADHPTLQDVSLTARPGTTTAVVGSSGSGKSTLVSLICRLYDATSGAVLVDGVDVRDYGTEQLWSAIGLVPQRGYLFSGTVADNLRYGKSDASDSEMWEALRLAAADNFVHAHPDGLQMPIAQGGSNLSGGQRQMLAIARAVISHPAIYLFDDAFSALDVHSDARIRASLREVSAHSTVIIVAQRISTVAAADQIVVLDEGKVVGVGRHGALLINCPTYAELANLQSLNTAVAGQE